jgi:hypothetical protein
MKLGFAVLLGCATVGLACRRDRTEGSADAATGSPSAVRLSIAPPPQEFDPAMPWDPLDLTGAERLCDQRVAEACVAEVAIYDTRQALCADYLGKTNPTSGTALAECPDDPKAVAASERAIELFRARCLTGHPEFCTPYLSLTYAFSPGPGVKPYGWRFAGSRHGTEAQMKADPAFATYLAASVPSDPPDSDCTERGLHCEAAARRHFRTYEAWDAGESDFGQSFAAAATQPALSRCLATSEGCETAVGIVGHTLVTGALEEVLWSSEEWRSLYMVPFTRDRVTLGTEIDEAFRGEDRPRPILTEPYIEARHAHLVARRRRCRGGNAVACMQILSDETMASYSSELSASSIETFEDDLRACSLGAGPACQRTIDVRTYSYASWRLPPCAAAPTQEHPEVTPEFRAWLTTSNTPFELEQRGRLMACTHGDTGSCKYLRMPRIRRPGPIEVVCSNQISTTAPIFAEGTVEARDARRAEALLCTAVHPASCRKPKPVGDVQPITLCDDVCAGLGEPSPYDAAAISSFTPSAPRASSPFSSSSREPTDASLPTVPLGEVGAWDALDASSLDRACDAGDPEACLALVNLFMRRSELRPSPWSVNRWTVDPNLARAVRAFRAALDLDEKRCRAGDAVACDEFLFASTMPTPHDLIGDEFVPPSGLVARLEREAATDDIAARRKVVGDLATAAADRGATACDAGDLGACKRLFGVLWGLPGSGGRPLTLNELRGPPATTFMDRANRARVAFQAECAAHAPDGCLEADSLAQGRLTTESVACVHSLAWARSGHAVLTRAYDCAKLPFFRNMFYNGDDSSLRRGCDAGDLRACDRLILQSDNAFDRDRVALRAEESCAKGDAEGCYVVGELREAKESSRISDALCRRRYGALCPPALSTEKSSIASYLRACELGLGVGCLRAEELLKFDPVPNVTSWQPGGFLVDFAHTKPLVTPESQDEHALRIAACRSGLLRFCAAREVEEAVKKTGDGG